MEEFGDEEMTVASKLCDVKFSLGSFKIDLTKDQLTPLAKFEMGTVETSFLANADGSFALDFMLASVQMEDLIAVGSVFPLILCRLEPSSSRCSHAFQFRLKKSKN